MRKVITAGACAWVMWTVEPQDSRWSLHSAYTFRATCLIRAVAWDHTNFDDIGRADVTRRKRTNADAGGRSWCLPAGVRPE